VHQSVAAASTVGNADPAELQESAAAAAEAFADSVVHEAKASWSKAWASTAHAELHIAKQTGAVQAIINKLDVYQSGDGADSLVSIVPGTGNCEDCELRQLFEQGSNADAGVKHTRQNRLHVHWKTTMPPLHPGCGCQVVFVPKGMGWSDGKLTVLNEQVFIEELRKAVDTGSMSATIKPPGPSAATTSAPAVKASQNPGSIKGAAAPGNVAGPGRPAAEAAAGGGAGGAGGAGSGESSQYEPCSMGNPDDCLKADGNGSPTHKKGGTIEQLHAAYRAKHGGGESATAAKHDDAAETAASAWGAQPNARDVVRSHLQDGNITSIRSTKDPVTEEAKGSIVTGATDSFVIAIEGNGRGILKPPMHYKANAGFGAWFNGPNSSSHNHEAAAHSMYVGMGMPDHAPVTVTRDHAGQRVSVQQLKEGYVNLGTHHAKATGGESLTLSGLLSRCPAEHKDAMRDKVTDIAFMDLVMNQGDSHLDNYMLSEDASDIVRIDSGQAFGHSMFGVSSGLFDLISEGKKGPIPLPDHIRSRLETTSFGDTKKMLGEHLPEWQVGQQFMRQKYVVWLDQHEGGLDPEKFQGVDAAVRQGLDLVQPANKWRVNAQGHPETDTDKQQAHTFYTRMKNGQLPHQLFESFAKGWIDDAKSDPAQPDHATAVELDAIGIFMPHSALHSPDASRKQGDHREYEKTIVGNTKPVGALYSAAEAAAPAVKPRASAPSGAATKPDSIQALKTTVEKSLPLFIDLTSK
jgi:hypothetical protein